MQIIYLTSWSRRETLIVRLRSANHSPRTSPGSNQRLSGGRREWCQPVCQPDLWTWTQALSFLFVLFIFLVVVVFVFVCRLHQSSLSSLGHTKMAFYSAGEWEFTSSVHGSMYQSINQSINQPVNHLIHQSARPINQSINQSINQCINHRAHTSADRRIVTKKNNTNWTLKRNNKKQIKLLSQRGCI